MQGRPLFSCYDEYGACAYAVKQGYIPVIDMQNGRNTYLEEGKVGRENAWEYYFEQPCGYRLADIRDAKNVILSDGLITEKMSILISGWRKAVSCLLTGMIFFKSILR